MVAWCVLSGKSNNRRAVFGSIPEGAFIGVCLEMERWSRLEVTDSCEDSFSSVWTGLVSVSRHTVCSRSVLGSRYPSPSL